MSIYYSVSHLKPTVLIELAETLIFMIYHEWEQLKNLYVAMRHVLSSLCVVFPTSPLLWFRCSFGIYLLFC